MSSEAHKTILELISELSISEKQKLLQELDVLTDPFYQCVEGHKIEQGDIIEDFPVFDPPADLPFPVPEEVSLPWLSLNAVVMSQTCDMVEGRAKIDHVLLCPVFNREELGRQHYLSSDVGMEDARRGNLAGYHVLAECSLPSYERPVRIAEFRRIYSMPLGFVRQRAAAAGERIQLLSPYREHLSQAFARFFMRVGLPTDIPPFLSNQNNVNKIKAEVIKKLSLLDYDARSHILSMFATGAYVPDQ